MWPLRTVRIKWAVPGEPPIFSLSRSFRAEDLHPSGQTPRLPLASPQSCPAQSVTSCNRAGASPQCGSVTADKGGFARAPDLKTEDRAIAS